MEAETRDRDTKSFNRNRRLVERKPGEDHQVILLFRLLIEVRLTVR